MFAIYTTHIQQQQQQHTQSWLIARKNSEFVVSFCERIQSCFFYNKLPIHQDTLLQSNQRNWVPRERIQYRGNCAHIYCVRGRPFKTVDIIHKQIAHTRQNVGLCEHWRHFKWKVSEAAYARVQKSACVMPGQQFIFVCVERDWPRDVQRIL